MHKKLHKNVNDNMFSFTFLCNFSCIFGLKIFISQIDTNIYTNYKHITYFYGGQLKQLYTANFLYVFLIHLKWRSSSSFPNLMVQLLLSQNSTGPLPRLQKGRKIPESVTSDPVYTDW